MDLMEGIQHFQLLLNIS